MQINRAMASAFIRPVQDHELVLPANGDWRDLRLENWEIVDGQGLRGGNMRSLGHPGLTGRRAVRTARPAPLASAAPPRQVEPAGPPVESALFELPTRTTKPLICRARPEAVLDDLDRSLEQRDQVGPGWIAHRWLIPPGRKADRADPSCADYVCARCGEVKRIVEETGLGRFNWKTGKNSTLPPAPRAEARTW